MPKEQLYKLIRNGVIYVVVIVKVSSVNPDQVLVESVTGPMYYGWVSVTELVKY